MKVVDEKYIDLMNRSLDGVLSTREQTEFNAFLENSPEGRQYFHDLQQALQTLATVPAVNPPEALVRNVMGAIGPARNTADNKPHIIEKLGVTFRNRFAWRYASAFSAGAACCLVAVAIISYAITPALLVNPSQSVGTILPNDTYRNFRVIDAKTVHTDGLQASLKTEMADNFLRLSITMSALQETEVEIVFDTADLDLAGVEMPKELVGSFSGSGLGITIRQTGDGEYILLFVDKSSKVSAIACTFISGTMRQTEILASERPQ